MNRQEQAQVWYCRQKTPGGLQEDQRILPDTTYKATIITPDDDTYTFGPYEALSPVPLERSRGIGRLNIPLAAGDLPASLALASLTNDDYELVITFSQPDETVSVGGDIVAIRPADTWVQVTVDFDAAL